MLFWSRIRLELARRPWMYWTFAAVCALVAWWSVHAAAAAADRARLRWGAQRTVLVATRDLAPGDRLAVERREYPAAMVPATALTPAVLGQSGPNGDGVAARAVPEGSVLVDLDLVGDTAPPSGWVVFATGAGGSPALQPGDRVAVFGEGHRWCDGRIVVGTLGVGRHDGQVTVQPLEVAVPPDCADAVSGILIGSGIVLARTG